MYIGAYIVAELLTIVFYLYVVFPLLWGLAYSSFSAATTLMNVSMFLFVPFGPMVTVWMWAKKGWVFPSVPNAWISKVAVSLQLGVAGALVSGVVLMVVLLLANAIFG